MAENSIDLTWKDANKNWFLFTNNQTKIKKKTAEELLVEKKTSSKFYFSPRKPETKGTIVYTPLGYGIIQEIKTTNDTILIKLNSSQKIQEFQSQQVMVDIPINITFMSSSFQGEDTLTVPITMSSKDIVMKIESSFIKDGESIINVQVFFKEKLGVFPNSKFLAIPEIGIPFILSRFQNFYEGWGYSDKCINAISFMVNKSVKIRGFGIFTPDNSYNDSRSFSTHAKFILGTDDSGQILFSKEMIIAKSETPENKIFKFYFDRPIRIKAGESYTCAQEAVGSYSCYTYYGDSGQYEIVGEKDVIFTFAECYTSLNNTNRSCGQIPEIYYYA